MNRRHTLKALSTTPLDSLASTSFTAPSSAEDRFARSIKVCVSSRASVFTAAVRSSGTGGKPPMCSPRSAGCSHAAQGRQTRSQTELCIACLAGDECRYPSNPASRRLAHTTAIFRSRSNLSSILRGQGNVRFRFVTELPTGETMLRFELWMQVQKRIKPVDITMAGAIGR